MRESQKNSLILVFEDLHWIDSETQAFLDSLVESLPMARILLLVDYRPGYNQTWVDKTYYTQIRVDRLPSTGADELLQHLLGNNEDLAPLKELLIKRTEGNPFFVEESVRSLAETGILIGEKGGYRPGLKIEAIRIPSTVQTVLADRVDRLPLDEKQLLQTAAVIGVIVPLPLLRSVSELPEDELYQYLARLQAAEFLYETNLFPELEYTFKHALTNEVVYGALLQSAGPLSMGALWALLRVSQATTYKTILKSLLTMRSAENFGIKRWSIQRRLPLGLFLDQAFATRCFGLSRP
jgi:predicted ATPase